MHIKIICEEDAQMKGGIYLPLPSYIKGVQRITNAFTRRGQTLFQRLLQTHGVHKFAAKFINQIASLGFCTTAHSLWAIRTYADVIWSLFFASSLSLSILGKERKASLDLSLPPYD